ncbi:PREDICTED: gamma-glutamyltranspeptidase 2-like [Camelina sativa]|uniref:Glutathione hydrolase n=2 Tax=Camelina sativa TaxID=90675 RepID=A0ABM0TV52_CAMSA|nr:PREDICTED: gamma-glutamyltranspeptidase 2-like [Camelina sativa]
MMNSMSFVRTATIALLIIAFLQNGVAARKKSRNIVRYHGAVATDDGRCSHIGKNVLRHGGNAIDASVAAALCLGVVSAASSGIGGGAFAVIKLADGKEIAYDSRETAPLRATENMYGDNPEKKKIGALSVGVPGEVAGLFTAWKQHGKLPWKRLVSPAKKLAAHGFKISKYLYMQMNASRSDILADKGLSEVYATNGELKNPGTICRNPKLAFTLSQIAKYGPKAFYNGTVGVNLVRDIQKAGGIITMKDLQNYKVKVTEPLSADVLGYRLLGMPPPSSGGAAMVLILNILAQYGVPSGVSGPLGVHRLVEALKHAFAIRMNLGDPDFVPNVSKVVSDMLSPKFAQKLKRKIKDKKTFDPKHYGGKWNQINDHGTSHLSVMDSERNVVSMTSTINGYFGAHMISPSTGMVLNNEMDDFSIPRKSGGDPDVPPPAPANFIRPGKRPLSSMTPTIVLKDGKVKAALGASGGMYIIAGTTEVFLNHFVHNMDPLSSVAAPRIYHQVIPNKAQYENWTTVYNDHFEIPKETRLKLEKKGHVLAPIAGGTISQLIVVQEPDKSSGGMSKLVAVSDPRKGGYPSGY